MLKKNRTYLLYMGITVIVILLTWYVSTFHYQIMLIQGESMMPTYHNLQFVMLGKHCAEYKAGDVVAFYAEELECVLVKRIIGVPGDVVAIFDGTLVVNDVPSEFYEDEIFEFVGELSSPVELQKDEYIVVGDNISYSIDSRYSSVGVVKRDMIKGKIL